MTDEDEKLIAELKVGIETRENVRGITRNLLRIIDDLQKEAEVRELSAREDAAWVISTGGSPPLYTAMDANGVFIRVRDVAKALWFARRQDAEVVATEDEDAWRIIEVAQARAEAHLTAREREEEKG